MGLIIEGPDALKLLSYLGVNTFKNCTINKAKQFVPCSYDGYVIGDGILFSSRGGSTGVRWLCADGQPERTAGKPIRTEGTVCDSDGAAEPVGDAMVEIWHADGDGRYRHPVDGRSSDVSSSFIGFDRVATSPDGSYRLDTVKPGTVPGRGGPVQAPHLNAQVLARGLLDHVTTRIYFSRARQPTMPTRCWCRCPTARRHTRGHRRRGCRRRGTLSVRHRASRRERDRVLRRLRAPLADIVPLQDAIADTVRDGDVVAMEGFTHLIPFAAGHEVIRQGRRQLTLVRMTPDLIYDQLIGAGCVAKLVFSWGGNPGVGSLHRLRDAVENGWPNRIEIEEHSHAAMAAAYAAGASGLPFAVLRGYAGSDLRDVNPNIASIACPFTGEELSAVPSITPDVTLVHAQRADRHGNVLVEGIVGVQKEAVLAARRSVVTVEEIVDDLAPPSPNSVVLPSWTVDAVAVAPRGAAPSYAHGYYDRDNAFYRAWDDTSRDRERFRSWIDEHVLSREAS